MTKEISRSRLLSTLSAACELEHGLACSYLYAAFTIKTEIGEGISWSQQQTNRLLASRIYHIAAQEMYHLSQAWNVIVACGGVPHIGRPDYPTPAKNFPLNEAALVLRKYDMSTLNRFIYYESPHDTHSSLIKPSEDWSWPLNETFSFSSVGELYSHCKDCIRKIGKTLFIGNSLRQVTTDELHFPELITVTDVDSACEAIDRIIEQGEGVQSKRDDSHWDVFSKLRETLSDHGDINSISRNVVDNPKISKPIWDTGEISVAIISNPLAQMVCDLFNDVYIAMLQSISAPYNSHQDQALRKQFAQSSIELMVTVLKPIGEACCFIPFQPGSNLMAGPTFEIERYIPLSGDLKIASIVYKERLQTLADRGAILSQINEIKDIPKQKIKSAVANLHRLAEKLN